MIGREDEIVEGVEASSLDEGRNTPTKMEKEVDLKGSRAPLSVTERQ
jgi:hypothetical protein